MGLGTLLLDRGVLTADQLQQAIDAQHAAGERLDRTLVRLGIVRRDQVLEALGEQFHMPVVDLATLVVERDTLASVPPRFVFRHSCVPVALREGVITIATCDPYDLALADELRMVTGKAVELVLADDEEVRTFIRANYGVGGDTLDALAEGARLPAEVIEGVDAAELEQAQEASVVRLVNDLLIEAIQERATDVHVEPYERELVVRYRIDGVLQRASVPPTINRFAAAIISRLKIMANLNIAEKRRPQDGRITFRHRPQRGPVQEFDLRVSIIPMLYGEGVVLRVLSKTAALLPLEQLGMPEGVLPRWARLIERPHGILLVTGPTGSGKSTTLYASLNRIVSDEVKVITVEDPVEYHVSGVNQIQVNHRVGLDFSSGLRSILRHDPDVVMIGEIRDKETAETAVQASLTGHLVFSTLHTNDAPGATTRLLDMGVEPFLVSSSLEGVLAQRLVRRVCSHCAEPITHEPHDFPEGYTPPAGATYQRGRGCRECRNTGFRGRVGVYELLECSGAVRDLVMHRANAQEVTRAAKEEGALSRLIDDGLAKAAKGVTTLEEVLGALAG
ncbi:MAG: GspE/PulE family protein [Phycisphaerales bacterium]|jgi:general secretion pathway protein E/type IV pilus assembly protein PilB|nr:GspE/PulE family protein [Phycisphaerales bacterium]